MTNLEAKQALARKLDINYATIASNEMFSDADLQEYLQSALLEVWDMHPWPFTENTYSIPTTSGGVTDGYYDYPDNVMLGSIRRLAIGGKEFTGPLRFEDYLKYFENNPSGTDRIWAVHQEFIFVNAYAYTVGDDIDVLGKDVAPVLSEDTDLLPFSPVTDDKEHSGNKAIVELAYAFVLTGEKLQNPGIKKFVVSEQVRNDVHNTLNALWKPFSEFKSLEQSQDRPLFDVPDMFATRGRKNSSPTGNFN